MSDYHNSDYSNERTREWLRLKAGKPDIDGGIPWREWYDLIREHRPDIELPNPVLTSTGQFATFLQEHFPREGGWRWVNPEKVTAELKKALKESV